MVLLPLNWKVKKSVAAKKSRHVRDAGTAAQVCWPQVQCASAAFVAAHSVGGARIPPNGARTVAEFVRQTYLDPRRLVWDARSRGAAVRWR